MAASSASAAVSRLLLSLTSTSLSSSSSSLATVAAVAGTVVVGGGGYHLQQQSSSSLSSSATTRCEAAAAAAAAAADTKQQPSRLRGANLRSRMTAIGHFSILSETSYNPSITTFVMTLSGTEPFGARDFCSLWKEKGMAERHPRFHLRASETHPGHFESTRTTAKDKKSSSSSNDDDDDDPVELHVSESLAPQIPRTDILQRIRQMQTQPWSLSEKLWHVSVVPWNTPLGQVGTMRSSSSSSQSIAGRPATAAATSSAAMGESLLLFRGHHVLADGASMGAALMDLSDEADDFRQLISVEMARRRRNKKRLTFWQRVAYRCRMLLWLWLGSIRALLYQSKLYLYTVFWDSDPWAVVKKAHDEAAQRQDQSKTLTGNGEEQQEATTAAPDLHADMRSVSYTTVAPLAQAKWIAETLSNHRNKTEKKTKKTKNKITVNDLFVTAITAAVTRQLNDHRQRLECVSSYRNSSKGNQDDGAVDEKKSKSTGSTVVPRQDRIHVSVPVHLKGGVVLPGESVGNNIGAFTVQLPGEEEDEDESKRKHKQDSMTTSPPVQRLFAVHDELTKVKQTPAPLLSNLLARWSVACLPSSWTSYLFQRASAGSTCVITNVRGPSQEPIHIRGRTVESIYGFVPLPPGIPIGVVVSSYADQMLLTVTAESWAVPNADLFLSYVLEEYLVLLKEASRVAVKK